MKYRDQKLGPHSSGSREFACGFFFALVSFATSGKLSLSFLPMRITFIRLATENRESN
jgi:hypothetical protein